MFSCFAALAEQLGKVKQNNRTDQILFKSLTVINFSTALLRCPRGLLPESECKITTPFSILQIFRQENVFYSMNLTFVYNTPNT